MSYTTPLDVTLELPASELMEHEGAILVRCPINRAWVPLSDYYSEAYGSLLPLVGRVDYEASGEEWVNTGTDEAPAMEKRSVEAVSWKEVVRILPAVETPAEGGIIEVGVGEDVGTKDKF